MATKMFSSSESLQHREAMKVFKATLKQRQVDGQRSNTLDLHLSHMGAR